MGANIVTKSDSIRGCLLGTAVGDAIGLPFEGLSRGRRARLFGPVKGYKLLPWVGKFGWGMGSDDIELTVHTARALIEAQGDVNRFGKALGWSLRCWFLCLPPGIGKATALGCLRLLAGYPVGSSGVFSAGNGPAMRSALIGVMYGKEDEKLRAFVRASTRLTHTDPLAETGALLVALAAGTKGDWDVVLARLEGAVATDERWAPIIQGLKISLKEGETTLAYAQRLCPARGVSGFMLHTVPVALHAALSSSTVGEAVIAAVDCGGDTDTTGAIAGAISGARFGATIPQEWLSGWRDVPITLGYMEEVAEQLRRTAAGREGIMIEFSWFLALGRNIWFLGIILLHIIRRMLPPYGN